MMTKYEFYEQVQGVASDYWHFRLRREKAVAEVQHLKEQFLGEDAELSEDTKQLLSKDAEQLLGEMCEGLIRYGEGLWWLDLD